jgi:hypothetical protein
VDKEITAALIQQAEDPRRLVEAVGRLVMDGKGKGVDLNKYRLVEGGPKGLAWMNTPLN